jgi:tRNA threonylcarbamoyladenosine modification (KEOPS) complex  Pcc1 subunit
VSRHKSCTAKIQLSFGRKQTELGKEVSALNSKSKCFTHNSRARSINDYKNGSAPDRVAECVSVALRPPRTISLTSVDSADLGIEVRVTSDDKSNVFIDIESNDISSLRAIINSYLRLADASYRCITQGDAD